MQVAAKFDALKGFGCCKVPVVNFGVKAHRELKPHGMPVLDATLQAETVIFCNLTADYDARKVKGDLQIPN